MIKSDVQPIPVLYLVDYCNIKNNVFLRQFYQHLKVSHTKCIFLNHFYDHSTAAKHFFDFVKIIIKNLDLFKMI